MWAKIVKIVQIAYGDEVLPQTMESNTYSRATTPEQIISAAVLESMKTNLDDWTLVQREYNDARKKMTDPQYVYKQKEVTQEITAEVAYNNELYFYNKSKEVLVSVNSTYSYITGKRMYGYTTMRVNDIAILDEQRNTILNYWNMRQTVIRKTKAVAAKALADMKRNEDAWQLAEKLMNMKRNDQGALVPITPDMGKDHDKELDKILVDIEETNKKAKADVPSKKPIPGATRVRSR